MAVVMASREADARTRSGASTTSPKGHKQRHCRPTLNQPSFNWNVTEKYVELLNCEMEATNILQTKTYELAEEEKTPMTKTGQAERASNLSKPS